MVLGFISRLLTFGQYYIVKICIPTNMANTMLPCPATSGASKEDGTAHRRLLWYEHRILAAVDTSACKKGEVPLISMNGLHQLHILIFFLAVFHVVYSAATMALGRLKIRGWKQWEQETASNDYEFSSGMVHLAPGTKFNFQKYIKRSLEDDFQTVVGISPVLWVSFVVFLLLNVTGWRALLWASTIPPFIILAVGTKLQAILTKMALEISKRHVVVQGIPLVQGSDRYFWLGRPQLVLDLIHFALFQNDFQITYFLWIWYEFGLKSCFHESFKLVVAKIVFGVAIVFVCSYVTLPLYALVAQMGSNMKKSIFDEQTSKALKKWHMIGKKWHYINLKKNGKGSKNSIRSLGGRPSPSMTPTSHGATIQRFLTTGHSALSSTNDEYVPSDHEVDVSSASSAANLIIKVDENQGEKKTNVHHPSEENMYEEELSFSLPASSK